MSSKIAFPRSMRVSDPTQLARALDENMRYLERLLNATFEMDHTRLSNVTAGQHHVKYTDAEVDAIVATHDAIVDAHHVKYTDAEVDAIVATHDAIVDAHHAKYTDGEVDTIVATHDAIASAHHAKYLDSEAVTAMGVKGDANPLNHDQGASAITALRAERITSGQTLTTTTGTTVVYNSILREDDTDSNISYSTSTGVITINTTGWYSISGGVYFAGNATGRRILTLKHEGNDLAGGALDPPGSSPFRIGQSTLVYAVATDTLEVKAFQSSGGDLDVLVSPMSYITIHKI